MCPLLLYADQILLLNLELGLQEKDFSLNYCGPKPFTILLVLSAELPCALMAC